MKKPLLLTTFIFALVALGEAQSTLTQPSLPSKGTVFLNAASQTTALTPGAGGANKTWDFSSATNDFSMNDTVVSLSSAPAADQTKFSTANLVTKSQFPFQAAPQYDYYLLNSSGLYQLNSSATEYDANYVEYDINAKDAPSDKMLPFPAAYNNYWVNSFSTKDSAYNANGVDYIRSFATDKDSNVVDGWGTVKTPAGTFTNALRVVTYNKSSSRDDDYMGGNWTYGTTTYESDTTYSWYVNGNPFPIIAFSQVTNYDANGGTVDPGYMVVYAISPSAATAILNPLSNSTSDASVYPNPSKGNFSISQAEKVIRVTNATGSEVSFSSYEVSNSIQGVEIQNHEQGLYFVTVMFNGQVRMVKASLN